MLSSVCLLGRKLRDDGVVLRSAERSARGRFDRLDYLSFSRFDFERVCVVGVLGSRSPGAGRSALLHDVADNGCFTPGARG